MITLFSIFKPMLRLNRIRQLNALLSWQDLGKNIQIIIFSKSRSLISYQKNNSFDLVSDFKTNSYGTPLLSDVFNQAKKKSKYSTLMYTNGDMIFLPDLTSTLKKISFAEYLVVGRRIEIKVANILSNPLARQKYFANRIRNAKRSGADAMDYFIFPKSVKLNMPPFAVGRTAWDNWMVYKFKSLFLPVLDASNSITAIHQSHDFQYANPSSNAKFIKEKSINWRLAGGRKYFFSANDSDWCINGAVYKRPLNKNSLIRKIIIFPVLHPSWAWFFEPILLVFNYLNSAFHFYSVKY